VLFADFAFAKKTTESTERRAIGAAIKAAHTLPEIDQLKL
jgi:hypothetical protein